MNSTDKKELTRLKAWAEKGDGGDGFYIQQSGESETFWINREKEDTYIMQYDFETVPDFENQCRQILKGKFAEEVQRIVSVAAFKNMPQEEIQIYEGVPDYRYTF